MVHRAYCEGFKVGYKKATTKCQRQINNLMQCDTCRSQFDLANLEDDCMNGEKDLAEKIYWILIKEGQNYLSSTPLGQRMFFTPEDVKTIIRKHLDELQ